MLCYRCGSHNSDSSEACAACGQKLDVNQTSASTLSKRVAPGAVDGAPYRPGDIVAMRFRIREIVGAGPLGFVFKVEDVAAGGDLALKALNPACFSSSEDREQFQRAIRLGRKLSHQNLVRVVEDGEDRGWPFFATQFVDGLSLRRIIDARRAKGQTFTLAEIEPLVTQIALALTAAHKLAPHGNLKPQNVLVQPDLLKLTDFALAQALPRDAFLQAHRAQRTDAYLAPELFAGGPVEVRTDVYALGVLLGELLTGAVPQDRVPPELSRLRPELSAQVDAVYRKAVSSSPGARFASPMELAAEVTALATPSLSAPAAPAVTEPAGQVPASLRRTDRASVVDLAGARLPLPPPPVPGAPEGATIPLDLSLLPAALRRTDETQQMDPGLIAQAIAAKVAASASSSGPAAPEAPRLGMRPLPSPPRAEDLRGTQPLELSQVPRGTLDQSPTLALPAFPSQYLQPAPLFGSSAGGGEEPGALRSNAMVWLVLLTVGALLLGSVGGYLLIDRLRQPAETSAENRPPPPAPAPPPAASRGEGTPAGTTLAAASAPVEEDPAPAPLLQCPEGMQLVPSGPFQMGTAKDDPMMGFDEKSLLRVDLAAFCIDEFEYPNRAKAVPRTQVSWAEAQKLCQADSKRLCEESEWEKACKGPEDRRFPYGSTFDASACNTETETGEDRRLSYAGGYDRCRSGFGIADLSGNVAEWTASSYGSGGDKALKGGAYDRPDYAARCSARRNGPPGTRAAEVGFRCCRDPE